MIFWLVSSVVTLQLFFVLRLSGGEGAAVSAGLRLGGATDTVPLVLGGLGVALPEDLQAVVVELGLESPVRVALREVDLDLAVPVEVRGGHGGGLPLHGVVPGRGDGGTRGLLGRPAGASASKARIAVAAILVLFGLFCVMVLLP